MKNSGKKTVKGYSESLNKARLNGYIEIMRSGYYISSHIERKRNKRLLKEARDNSIYDFDYNPLISIIIPTYNRGEILATRTIPSVLAQTHSNFELIIMGDHCTDDTEERVQQFNDKRIRFVNLTVRGNYPKDPHLRWMTAGSIPRNKGLDLASGKWIAPLDDDDEFSENHLKILLSHAIKNKLEMVYGKVQMEIQPGKWAECGSYPLSYKNICHLSVLYRSELRFFKYNVNSWKHGDEDDWDLWRRMKEAEVEIGFVNTVVGKHYLEQQQLYA
jgi:glycosyltransferase involved in cell wall biosynthesis